MKPPSKRADRIFGIILGACLATMLGGGIAWAMGRENGLILIYLGGVFAGFPLFHFAMHAPFREKRYSKSTFVSDDTESDESP